MECNILLITFPAFLCQVQSQLCVIPGVVPQIIADTPHVSPPQVVATTIIDNSVSNALANALQLLIISNLIESKLGASCLSDTLVNGIGPVLESFAPVCKPCCASPIEVTPPCPPIIETCIPNYYNGYLETVYPKPHGIPSPCGIPEVVACSKFANAPYGLPEVITTAPCALPVYSLPEVVVGPTCGGNYYVGVPELIAPNKYPYRGGCGVAEIISPCPFVPNYCEGVIEVVAPKNICNPRCNAGMGAQIPSISFNPCGVADKVPPLSPFNPGCGFAEIVAPCTSNYNGGPTEVISPFASCNPGCFGGVTDFISVKPYGSSWGCIPEVIPPCYTIPEVILPKPCSPFYPGNGEVISPISPCSSGFEFIGPNAFMPNCFGAPAQLTCHVTYEPLAFETFRPGCCY